MIEGTAAAGAARGRRAWVFAIVLVLFLCAMLEVMARLAGGALAARVGLDVTPIDRILAGQTAALTTLLEDSATLVVFDSTLGWRYRANYHRGDNQLNAAGMRASHEYAAAPAPGVRRIAVFGDSFAYGTEVANAESWAAILEQSSDSLEVLNYGVGGYGTDQSFLRFLEEGSRYAPHVVLIGFAPVNLRRIQNVYRRFIASDDLPIAKPRFVLADSGLELIPSPLRSAADYRALRDVPARVSGLATHDAAYEPLRYESHAYRWSAAARFAMALGYRLWWKYAWDGRLLEDGAFRESSEAFRLQRAVLNAFADSVRASGAQPVFILFPDQESVARMRGAKGSVYSPLREALERDSRAEVIDLIDVFASRATRVGLPSLFAPGRHYSALGNAIVAEALARRFGSGRAVP